MQRILDELRRLGKKGGVWKCLENVLEFGKQALAHYLRDHSISINDMMVKDKDSGTTFVVSALPHTCISRNISISNRNYKRSRSFWNTWDNAVKR